MFYKQGKQCVSMLGALSSNLRPSTLQGSSFESFPVVFDQPADYPMRLEQLWIQRRRIGQAQGLAQIPTHQRRGALNDGAG